MSNSEARNLFHQLRGMMAEQFHDFLANLSGESLVLELKKFAPESDANTGANSHKSTEKQYEKLCEVLCGMANSVGGVLILGVEEERKNNVVKILPRPLPSVQKTEQWLIQSKSHMIDPPQVIEHHVIYDKEESGYIVLFVEQAEDRPVLTPKTGQAFIRFTERNVIAHSDHHRVLRAARRVPRLQFDIRLIDKDRPHAWNGEIYQLQFHVFLQNVGPYKLNDYLLMFQTNSSLVKAKPSNRSFYQTGQQPIGKNYVSVVKNQISEPLLPSCETQCCELYWPFVSEGVVLKNMINEWEREKGDEEYFLTITLLSEEVDMKVDITKQSLLSILSDTI